MKDRIRVGIVGLKAERGWANAAHIPALRALSEDIEVVGAANIQLATCSPNFLILEGIERWDGFHAQILKTPIRWEAGYVIPPTEPGLGVELNESVIRNHPYAGHQLHLEMKGDPIE